MSDKFFDVRAVVKRYYQKGWATVPVCWKKDGSRWCTCSDHQSGCPGWHPIASTYAKLATELPPIEDLWREFWMPVLQDIQQDVPTKVWFELATVLRDTTALEAKTFKGVQLVEQFGELRTGTMRTPTGGKIWFFKNQLPPVPLDDEDLRTYGRGDVVPLPWS